MTLQELTSEERQQSYFSAKTVSQKRMHFFKMLEQGLWFDKNTMGTPLTQEEARKWMSQQWYKYLEEEEDYTLTATKQLCALFSRLEGIYEIKYGVKFKLLEWRETT